MRNDEPSASFLARWMRARPSAVQDDPADYGTAFGLDLSMAEGIPHPVEPLPAHAAKAGDGWLARWRRAA
jgi:hypothetical protein